MGDYSVSSVLNLSMCIRIHKYVYAFVLKRRYPVLEKIDVGW